MHELDSQTLVEIMRQYVEAGRSVQIRGQANSLEWEADLEAFIKDGPWGNPQRGQNPDFMHPFNFDLKSIRADRNKKSFSISGLTIEEATSGVLPYRLVILLWEDLGGWGRPVDALVIDKHARSVLSDWSFGLQVKAGITNSIIKEMGVKGRTSEQSKDALTYDEMGQIIT